LEGKNLGFDKIVSYEKIFDFGGTACATLIKLKIINESIQIERPRHLAKSKICALINQLVITEKYIAIKNQKLDKFKERWKPFLIKLRIKSGPTGQKNLKKYKTINLLKQ
jgi:hypothetical protein